MKIILVPLLILNVNTVFSQSAHTITNIPTPYTKDDASVSKQSTAYWSSQEIWIDQLDTSNYSGKFILQPDTIPVGNSRFTPIWRQDYNNDGSVDYFGTYESDTLGGFGSKASIAEKSGLTGHYEPSFFFPDTSIAFFKAADINSDGITDYLLQGRDNNRDFSLRCFTMDPATGYPDSLMFHQFILPIFETFPVIGHLDDDTLTDMFIYSDGNTIGSNYAVSVYEYDPGEGDFQLRQAFPSGHVREFSAGDIDNDNCDEIVTCWPVRPDTGMVVLFKNTANNTWKIDDSLRLPAWNLYGAQFSSDLDEDGQPEIFVSAQHGNGSFDDYASIYWLFFDGHHLQVKFELILRGVNIFSELYIHPFDIDNDGLDELNINYGRNVLMLKWSDANGEFKVEDYQDMGPGSIAFINFEDVNNDQSPDLLVGITGPSPYTSYTRIYKNNILTGLAQKEENISSYCLYQNYPNPFNPVTTIKWRSEVYGRQVLKIYDILGREVAVLVDEERPAGTYETRFDASNLSSGLYIYRLQTMDYKAIKKMMLIK